MKSARAEKREKRHRRIRARVMGSAARPRLAVYRSNTRLIAQIIDDERGVTLAAVSSSEEKAKMPRERAEAAGKTLALRAQEKGVRSVVFDRGGFSYTGTIKAFADAARDAGLLF
jgi:large subunit ribosomal protein L18